jgi:myo-inositol-1(or 4)-monophosphatase
VNPTNPGQSTEASPIPAGVLDAARQLTREAGALALASFRRGLSTTADVQYKDGGSPVTAADLAVDDLLRRNLRAMTPDYGWLSEETTDDRSRLERRTVWVVDPIDGTRAFARGDPDWTIAVGLVQDGDPIAGFVFAPVVDEFFEALPGGPALLNERPIGTSSRAGLAGARLAGPHPMLDRLAQGHPIERAPKIHSLAYRIIQVADGRLDAGLAGGRSNDWDLAAAHAVLLAAGGVLNDGYGRAPRYNRPTTLQPPLAASGRALAGVLADAVRRLGDAS